MSDFSEYQKEKEIYLARLEVMAKALWELEDPRARFVASVRDQIERQGLDRWGPTQKQSEVLKAINAQYGKVLFDSSARRDLIRKQKNFLKKLDNLRIREKSNIWLQKFLLDIEAQIAKRKPLSEKQKKVLKRYLDKQ